jgi:hypothetical protein
MKNWLVSTVFVCLFASVALQAKAANATFHIIKDPVKTWTNYAL